MTAPPPPFPVSRSRCDSGHWPTSGCASIAFAAISRSPAHRRLGRQPLVRRNVLHEPEQLRRERRLRQRLGAVAPDPRRHLDHVVVGQARRACRRSARPPPARRPSRSPARPRAVSRPRCRTRRRAARAAPASRPAPGRGTCRAARARSPRPPAPAACRSLHLGQPLVLACRSSAGSSEGWRPARGSARRAARTAPATASMCSASTSSSTSRPSRYTARIQVRWLRPTWSTSTRPGSTPIDAAIARWKPIATLQSPTARWPASSSARVTIPTGFVKSTIQAPPAARSRARSAMSSTTGTVRSALARPPAPVVSWPMQPQATGIVSSRRRASWPPTRIWISTKSAPSSARSSSPVSVSAPS